MATDLERFSKIIRDNPGATYRQDNDKWYIVKPLPVDILQSVN